MAEPGTELAVLNVTDHERLLTKKLPDLDKWCLPGADLRGDALVRYALHEMSLDVKLRDCTPSSIYLALLACAVTGLVPGRMKSQAFLIPYKNTRKTVDAQGNGKEITTMDATFMIGWRGYAVQAFRAGLHIVSAVIRQNDHFDFDKGTEPYVRYRPALSGPGAVIGAAAWCKLPRGGLEVEYLGLEELGKVEQFAMAKSGGNSPAWSGPFKDQMQRKTAVRRLGKQIEMGEAFHRAEMIEIAQVETGTIASALDAITDGEASRTLGDGFKTEVMRQLPAAPPPERPKSSAAKPASKPVETTATQRPTSPPPSSGGSSGAAPAAATSGGAAAPSSAGTKLDEAKAKVEAKANPTSPASNTAPSASTGSASTPTTANGADSGFGPQSSTEPSAAQVEEAASDDGFDVSFGNDADEQVDPPTGKPETPEQWLAALAAWQATHATKDLVKAGRQEWQDLMRGWLASCPDKATMDAGKEAWTTFSTKWFTKSVPGNPTKGIAAFTGDPEVDEMKDMFARRWKAVPDGAR